MSKRNKRTFIVILVILITICLMYPFVASSRAETLSARDKPDPGILRRGRMPSVPAGGGGMLTASPVLSSPAVTPFVISPSIGGASLMMIPTPALIAVSAPTMGLGATSIIGGGGGALVTVAPQMPAVSPVMMDPVLALGVSPQTMAGAINQAATIITPASIGIGGGLPGAGIEIMNMVMANPANLVTTPGMMPLMGINPVTGLGLFDIGMSPGLLAFLSPWLWGAGIGLSGMGIPGMGGAGPDIAGMLGPGLYGISGIVLQGMGMPGMPMPMMGMNNPVTGMYNPMMKMPGPMMGMPGMGMPGMPMPGMPMPGMGMPMPMMEIGNPMKEIPGLDMGMPLPLISKPLIDTALIPLLQQAFQTPTQSQPVAAASGLLIPTIVPPPGNSCTACHGDLQIMTDLGYPQFYFDPVLVQDETGMPADCDDCHLGNPADFTLEGAHAGILGLLVMKVTYRDIIKRKDVVGLDYEKVKSILAIRESNGIDPRYRLSVQSPFHMLLWHDRNETTASWNPGISMLTCGRCHPQQVAEFNTTEMGLVQTMSQYIPWIVPPDPAGPGVHLKVAPQSCGLWTAATTPPNNDLFTEDNRLLYNSTSTRIANQFIDPLYPETSQDPLTRLQSLANQKNCNKCHPGCLDCHYVPFEENIPAAMGPGVKPAGTHTITKRPLVMNCMSGGRGQFCHAGAIERRRGDGFVKGGFAQVLPPDLVTAGTLDYLNTPDIHYNGDLNPANATCVDCHGPLPGVGGPPPVHGDMNRNPEPDRCAVCHPSIVAAFATGTHRNLTCGACHTPKIVGYAFNFWSPGTRFGITPSPLDRHSSYAVNSMTPILLVDENGKWAPYHVVPHISTHIDPLYLLVGNYLSPRILWRNQPDIGIFRQHPSRDGVAVRGFYYGADYFRDEGQVMVWMNIDKIAHSITSRLSALPPRTCVDCHTVNGTQRINASFGWISNLSLAYEGLYAGTFDIVADDRGLRVENLMSSTPSSAFDPMTGKWSVPGFYVIPQAAGPATGHPAGII